MITKEAFKKEVIYWADKVRVKPQQIQIRPMKRKWGSCSSKGRLSFNEELLEASDQKRSEVIIHELLHLRYPNHGKMFNLMLKKFKL